MGPLPIDPKLARRLRGMLEPGEEILWSARQSGPSWREWPRLTAYALLLALLLAVFVSPWQQFLYVYAVFFWPSIVLLACSLASPWFYAFAATTSRVIILFTPPLTGWSYLDYARVNSDAVRSHLDKGAIKFANSVFYVFRSGDYFGGYMKQYIDNVPEIEQVGALILERVAVAKAGQRTGDPGRT